MTGFWSSSGPPPDADPQVFLRWAHELARTLGGTLTRAAPHSTASFDHWRLTWPHGNETWLLHHHHFPYVAATAREPHLGTLEGNFVDVPGTIDSPGLTLLSAADLNRRLTEDDLVNLSEAELEQVRYWRPATPGALLFNHWD